MKNMKELFSGIVGIIVICYYAYYMSFELGIQDMSTHSWKIMALSIGAVIFGIQAFLNLFKRGKMLKALIFAILTIVCVVVLYNSLFYSVKVLGGEYDKVDKIVAIESTYAIRNYEEYLALTEDENFQGDIVEVKETEELYNALSKSKKSSVDELDDSAVCTIVIFYKNGRKDILNAETVDSPFLINRPTEKSAEVYKGLYNEEIIEILIEEGLEF